MKKIIFAIVSLFISVNISNAQDFPEKFRKNDNVLGVGFGVGGVYGIGGIPNQSPTFGLHYDRAIIELKMGGVIGAGGFVGYKNYTRKEYYLNDNYKEKWSIVVIGARGSFHYNVFKVDKLDTYGVAMVAFHIVDYKQDYPKNHPYGRTKYRSAAYASVLAGAKYYFAPSFAGFAEVGYGVSWITAGIAVKF